MNRIEFVETYIDAKEMIDMLDHKDRNIYTFLKIFGEMYTCKTNFGLKFDVKDYDEKDLDPSVHELIEKIENLFFVTKIEKIYRECIDIYGEELTINKFTVKYFEKRNKFIDKIVEEIASNCEENQNNNDEL